MKKGKIILISIASAFVLVLITVIIWSPSPKRTIWQQATEGNLAIVWQGESQSDFIERVNFHATFESSEPRSLTECRMKFDEESFPIKNLRFNLPQTPVSGNHYLETVLEVLPNTPYEIGQNMDNSGIFLKKNPQIIRLECIEGFSEWRTNFKVSG